MTQLANANLLDESVANSGSLKSRRLNNTAITASNPNPNPIPQPRPRPNPIPTPPPTTTLKKVDMNEEEEEEEEDFELSDDRADDYINYNNNNFSKMQEKPNDDKKILGMKPALFWTLLVGAAAVGAYFGYKYIKKKGMIGANAVPNAVPNVPNAVPNAVPSAVANVPNITNNIT